jgi:hypothetical protein
MELAVKQENVARLEVEARWQRHPLSGAGPAPDRRGM